MIHRVAYNLLKEHDPYALRAVTYRLDQYHDVVTEGTEKSYILTESAIWADDVKRRGGGWQSTWHYENIPIYKDEYKVPKSYYTPKQNNKNISAALPILQKFL